MTMSSSKKLIPVIGPFLSIFRTDDIFHNTIVHSVVLNEKKLCSSYYDKKYERGVILSFPSPFHVIYSAVYQLSRYESKIVYFGMPRPKRLNFPTS